MDNVLSFKPTNDFDKHLVVIEQFIGYPRILRELTRVLENSMFTFTEIFKNEVTALNAEHGSPIPVTTNFRFYATFKPPVGIDFDINYEQLFKVEIYKVHDSKRRLIDDTTEHDYRIRALTMLQQSVSFYIEPFEQIHNNLVRWFDYLYSQGFKYSSSFAISNMSMIRDDVEIVITFDTDNAHVIFPVLVDAYAQLGLNTEYEDY